MLKGYRTLIALPDGTGLDQPTGSPAMATGGTGDILTGMTAGMVAQFPDEIRTGRARRGLAARPRGRNRRGRS